MKKLLSLALMTVFFAACSDYLDEFKDEYEDSFVSVDNPENISSDSHGQTPGDGSKLSSAQTDASSSDAETGASSSSKKDDEHYDCYMNDSACISIIANEFGKTVRLFDSRNNNVYTAIYVGGLDYETVGSESVFNDSVSFLLMTENLEYEGDSVTALDTNGVFFYTYENAEKACPTGWRLPKITPEWFFLLTGNGNQFNIELPDNEKGCYIEGKFDSGKSIFYWAQKEGETSWFVKKGLYANDYDLHESCNTFPVRCAKEFGKYADYAGSSSSSAAVFPNSDECTGGDWKDLYIDTPYVATDFQLIPTGYDMEHAGVSLKYFSFSGYNEVKMTDQRTLCVVYRDRPAVKKFYLANINYGDYSVNWVREFDSSVESDESKKLENVYMFELKAGAGNILGDHKVDYNRGRVTGVAVSQNAPVYRIAYNGTITAASSSSNKILSSATSSSSEKSQSNSVSSSSKVSVFDVDYPVSSAAKYFKNSNGDETVKGSILFENGKMTNDSEINVVGFDSSFADGWMKVAGYISNSPYISFNTDPSGFKMPVDISAWGGICMTYASNVNINVVAHDSRNEGENEVYVTMSSKFEATTDNLVQSACVGWGGNATSLTNIDQIWLVPVSSSSSDPAVIYIKNISTEKKTDVKIDVDIVASCRGDGWFSCDVPDEQINLSLFESYTVDGLRCSQFDLGVSAGESKYYTNGGVCTSSDFTENITNIGLRNKTSRENADDDNLANVENPILTDVLIAGPEGGNFSITFHPKSWYAAPAPTSN